MATKAKARTRRMSLVLPRKFDDSTLEYLRNRLSECNEKERELETQRSETGMRFAPIYILEVRCLPGDGETTLCLLHTNGSQFQFTRWYEFLNRALGFVERMDQDSKIKQIDDYATRMRTVDSKSILVFDVPDKRTPMKKRSLDGGAADMQTPTKQLALSTPEKSYPPVPTRLYGTSSAVMLQQTVLTGALQPSSSQVEGEPLLSQHRAAVDGGRSMHVELFTPPDDAVTKLCHFLEGRYEIYKTHRTVEGRRDGESAEAYRERMQRQLNGVPIVGKVMGLFFPSALKKSRKERGTLETMLPAGHIDLLATLHKLCTNGVYSPSMRPDSQELIYSVDCLGGSEVTLGSCFLELWRRALKLESALADLLKFLMGIIECVSQSALNPVSPQTRGNLRALLESGAGLYGGGGDFWNPRPITCLAKLNEGGDPKVQETIKWLSDKRVDAFTALSPFIDELNVLLPTLAQVVTLRDELCHLDDLAVAQAVFKALSEDRKLRMHVYTSCCGWLVLYGGKLTWLVGQVHMWCEEFKPIATELRIEKPKKLSLLSLEKDGKIIGLNGHSLEKGHVDSDCEDGLLPFPAYCMSVKPLPMDVLRDMSKQYSDIQEGMLEAMVLSPGVAEALSALGRKKVVTSELPAVKCMRRGVENISAWLKDDSHTKMQTCFLPATASMPDAVYSPHEIYKAK